MASEVNDKIIECISNGRSFVLQGGAGSGKTETLKEILNCIGNEFHNKKIACITHTNAAANEINSRTENKFYVSTIHSFLYNLIKNYKKNIKEAFVCLYDLEAIKREEFSGNDDEKKEYNKKEHEKYKKLYEKYRTRAKNYLKLKSYKPIGKKYYDKEPEKYNSDLNLLIKEYNSLIKKHIEEKCDYNTIRYNETIFNNLKDFSFGHDGLLEVATEMINKYKLLKKIISDKYDIIFIDEFQDTNEKVLKVFLDEISSNKTILGLFGDEMQAIYKDGIGNVVEYIKTDKIVPINKPDNYRCSYEVVDFIKKIRPDVIGANQKVALKDDEKESQRHGSVKLYYSIIEKKPNSWSNKEEKEAYFNKIDALIEQVLRKNENQSTKFMKLLLSNSAVAKKLGFNNLFDIYSERYGEDLKDQMEKDCVNLMWLEIAELCNNYKNYDKNISPNHTAVIGQLKKYKYTINTFEKKKELCNILDELCECNDSIKKVTNKAINLDLIKESDARKNYIDTANRFLKDLESDEGFLSFENDYNKGCNTHKRMVDAGKEIEDDEFEDLKKTLLRKNFYTRLFSDEIKFKEILIYSNYLNENTDYMTMHKTKGTGKPNVMVVADEYFWSTEYDFNSIIMDKEDKKQYWATKKLFYVACSRAIKNLVVVRVIERTELENLLKIFETYEEEKLSV